ncbi:serine/threonine-protein kinase [Streptomyces ortus]|nr:serine/threonine-protein kinase [Streptomyces ortus]
MGNTGAAANELIAGRYRLQEVVHHEVGCVCWYGEDIEYARPRLLTQTPLPPGPTEHRDGPTAARIQHASQVMGVRCPGAVAGVIDVVEESGSLWTVVEWIDGMPLGEFLDQYGPLDHARAARIGLDVLGVLESAHGAGLVHGELSPGQVFVRDHGGVVLAGYGLAGAAPWARIGAPAYASPEQARGESYGSPADLWALGALLYTMTEGRPPFRDRGRPEATLRAIVRLPLRSPRHAGPLARITQGLLRKDPAERLTAPVVRDALVRIVNEDPAAEASLPPSRPSAHRVLSVARGRQNLGRVALIGTAVAAVVAVTMTALAATGDGSRDDDVSASDATASRPGPVLPTGDGNGTEASTPPSDPPSPTVSRTASASPSASPTSSPSSSSPSPSSGKLPADFRVFTAPEGFAVALPKGWHRLGTKRAEDGSYRVVFGADGDPRELAVTYSTRVGSDPVAVWRDTVEPSLSKESGYDRLGAIRATTYQGRKAADMEWVDESEGTRVRTFGRGFLIGGGEGFSIRWATPAADYEDAGNQRALKAFLATFRGLPD